MPEDLPTLPTRKPMTRKEEQKAFQRWHAGDEAVLDDIVRANLPFAISIAQRYKTARLPMDDTVSAAYMGLLEAANRFEPQRKLKFISFAVHWIRRYVLDAIAHSGTVRIPTNRQMDAWRIDEAVRAAEQCEETLTDVEVGELTGISAERVAVAQQIDHYPVSLNQDVSNDGSRKTERIHVLPGATADEVLAPLEERDQTEFCERLLSMLTDTRERYILRAYYGLDGAGGARGWRTLHEIGLSLFITRERVRQIRDQAEARIKQRMQTTHGHMFSELAV